MYTACGRLHEYTDIRTDVRVELLLLRTVLLTTSVLPRRPCLAPNSAIALLSLAFLLFFFSLTVSYY